MKDLKAKIASQQGFDYYSWICKKKKKKKKKKIQLTEAEILHARRIDSRRIEKYAK